MHVFMDESGTFVPEKGVAVGSALVVPDRQLAALQKLYGRLRCRLPKKRGEVKGSLLAKPTLWQMRPVGRSPETWPPKGSCPSRGL
jgi:hypothetical protein